MPNGRIIARAGTLTLSALLAASAAAFAGGLPEIPSITSNAKAVSFRPPQIVYTGDGSAFLAGNGASARSPGKLRWTSWAMSDALGSGADWQNNCTPNCAQGKYTAYPALVLAYRPEVLGRHLVFTRLTMIFPGAHPPYSAYKTGALTLRLKYAGGPGGNYFWN